jgi:transposase
VGNHFEKRDLILLSSQMKQEIIQSIWNSLKALSEAKKRGHKVGKLKFKHKFCCIPLKQPGCTFRFCNPQKTSIRIQRLGKFRVLGGRVIPPEAEIAKAYLIKKASGFFIKVTYYVYPEKELAQRKKPKRFKKAIAIDFGVKNQITLSNGLKFSWQVEETPRLKKMQRIFSKMKDRKGTRRWKGLKQRIAKEHNHIENIKREIANKIISLLKRYEFVVFQDDNLNEWKEGYFGRQVHHSALGGIKARLKQMKHSLATPRVRVIPQYTPTTKRCSNCGFKTHMDLSDRTFHCPKCGFCSDRDLNATYNMLYLVGLDRPEGVNPMPDEIKLVERLFSNLKNWVTISPPLTHQESHTL